MESLINANTPEKNAANINTILNNTNTAIANVQSSTTLLVEKAAQLTNHELIVGDSTKLGHAMPSSDHFELNAESKMQIKSATLAAPTAEHNADATSHGDVRVKLEEIPMVVTDPVISGPGTVKTGVSNTFTISATPLLPGAIINRINVTMPDGTIVAKSGVNIVNGTGVFDLVLTGDDLEVKSLKAQAFDSNGSPSAYASFDVTISTNTAPDLSGLLAVGLETYIEPFTSFEMYVDGGVDADGDPLTYSISTTGASSTILSFSKVANIAAGEVITVTVSAAAVRGVTYGFTVTGADGRLMGTATKAFTFMANRFPDVTALVFDGIPALVVPGNITCAIRNGSDADGQDVTYSITCDDPTVTFSKSTGLVNDESFSVTIDGMLFDRNGHDNDQKIRFMILANDGLASIPKAFAYQINSLPTVTGVVVTGLPAEVEGGVEYTLSIAGGVDPDGMGPVTYSVLNGGNATFSKTTGIAENEEITVTFTKVAENTSYDVSILAFDTNGESSAMPALYNVTIIPVYYTAAPTFVYPTNGAEIDAVAEGESYTFELSPYTAVLDI